MKKPKKGASFDAILQDPDPDIFRKSADPAFQEWINKANNQMWNWEDCSHRAKNAGLTPDQFWGIVKLSRRIHGHQTIPLRDLKGGMFHYRLPSSIQHALHYIDTHLGGSVQFAWPALESPDDQKRYLISSLCEEAISSSEIEGAVVTRKEAKGMLLKNKKPQNRDEQMVVNNFRTIQMLNHRRSEPLTVELLFEIQRELTENAMDDANASGRFRRPDEQIDVWDGEDHQTLHVPPQADELPERMQRLCDFANADSKKDQEFIHPAIRAILLHFWLAYDHPFVDGNGRTARALFYWSMLRHKYWLVEYLTISSIIRQHPKRYARAFLDTEQDDNDLTYFLLYHVQVIERSIQAFQDYLTRKIHEKKRLSQVLLPAVFNDRQQAILLEAQADPEMTFTYGSHARGHQVTLATARNDLLDLEKKGLLKGNRVGRRFHFVVVPNLEERLREFSKK
ncbi:MAG: Fic family protein [Planctomycetes bacterium]|nr:Fic family protein [Planctomycetota bacterium]